MPYKTYQEGGRRSTRKGLSADDDAEMKDVTNTSEDMQDEDVMDEEGGEKKKPWLQRTKEGGVKKIPKEVQKRRRNYRLKKMLTPKAPIMVLHELLGQTSVQYEVTEPASPRVASMPALYTAKTTYDDQTFSGMGPSKSIAKNICAEQVLQFITTKSCTTCKTEDDVEGDQENGGGRPRRDLETDTPWVSLASLALFKLFNDWQAQGYVVPAGMMRGNQFNSPDPVGGQEGEEGETTKKKKNKKEKEGEPKGEKTLPENASEKHPVQLLNEMAGPLVYEQTGQVSEPAGQTGTPPSCVFTLSVTVNGETYSGQGKSKKEAKKAAAVNAVGALYGIDYPATV